MALPQIVAMLAQSAPDIELEDVVGEGLTTRDYVIAGAVFFGSILLAIIVGRIIHHQIERSSDGDAPLAITVRRSVRAAIVIVGLVITLQILDVRITPLLGALGIVVLALAFAAQPILENAFASTVLRRRQHFGRGDEISIDETTGSVVDVNLRNVVLRSFDGERVTVPCSIVVKSTVVNFTTMGSRRTNLSVGVHYRTDLHAAQETILESVASVAEVARSPRPEAWVVGFFDSSIDFVVRYWCAPDIATYFRVRSEVAMAIKQGFDEAGIEIPFPQRVVTVAPEGALSPDALTDGEHP